MTPLCVLATSCVPEGIRGALNQWMLEVLPGVFIGRPSARIRTELWNALSDAFWEIPDSYAALITQADTEQGFRIDRLGNHRYAAVDFDGLQLITVRHRNSVEAAKSVDSAIGGL